MDGIPSDWPRDHVYDGGDLACGQLLLDLRIHFRTLPAQAMVVVRSVDEGAPLEIPAWCRVMGHRLVAARHPHYLVNKS